MSNATAQASSTDPNDPLKVASIRLHQLKVIFRSPRKTKTIMKLGLPKILEKLITCRKSGEKVSFLQRLKQRIKTK
jgi:hypothetical protein